LLSGTRALQDSVFFFVGLLSAFGIEDPISQAIQFLIFYADFVSPDSTIVSIDEGSAGLAGLPPPSLALTR